MIRALNCLILAIALSGCSSSDSDSLPNRIGQKVSAGTVKVGNKTEYIITRTGEKIETAGERFSRKIRHAGETLEGNN